MQVVLLGWAHKEVSIVRELLGVLEALAGVIIKNRPRRIFLGDRGYEQVCIGN